MVVAVGLNPTIDRTITVPGFAIGATLKAESVRTLASGKGANVAAMLHQLGVPVRFVGMVGEEEVHLYRERLAGVPCDIVEVADRTRMDTTIIVPASSADEERSETHIREPGFDVSDADVDHAVAMILDAAEPGDLVVMSGSLPPGASQDVYAGIIGECRQRGVETLLDTSGAPLVSGVAAAPTYLKPNQEELADLVSQDTVDSTRIVGAARELIQRGTRAVAVTLGGEGALLVERGTAWRGRAPAPEVVNTVGSGDAFASGWIAARLAGEPPMSQLQRALALGAANAMSHGACVVEEEHIRLMRDRAEVDELR